MTKKNHLRVQIASDSWGSYRNRTKHPLGEGPLRTRGMTAKTVGIVTYMHVLRHDDRSPFVVLDFTEKTMALFSRKRSIFIVIKASPKIHAERWSSTGR